MGFRKWRSLNWSRANRISEKSAVRLPHVCSTPRRSSSRTNPMPRSNSSKPLKSPSAPQAFFGWLNLGRRLANGPPRSKPIPKVRPKRTSLSATKHFSDRLGCSKISTENPRPRKSWLQRWVGHLPRFGQWHCKNSRPSDSIARIRVRRWRFLIKSCPTPLRQKRGRTSFWPVRRFLKMTTIRPSNFSRPWFLSTPRWRQKPSSCTRRPLADPGAIKRRKICWRNSSQRIRMPPG